jgi:hypothetical protein
LVVAGALLVAWRQGKEAQRLRKDQARPFVVIDFNPWGTIIELQITNIGSTLARNVNFEFTPPLTSTHDERSSRASLMQLNLFKHGIPSLPPRKEVKLFFDSFPARLSGWASDDVQRIGVLRMTLPASAIPRLRCWIS